MYKITIQYAPYRKAIGFVILKIFSKTSVFIDSKQAIPVHLSYITDAGRSVILSIHESHNQVVMSNIEQLWLIPVSLTCSLLLKDLSKIVLLEPAK